MRKRNKGKRVPRDRCVVSTMQFIHIRYTKHEDNEKDENVRKI